MKNFVEQISIKLEGFYLVKMNLVQTIHQNIGKNLYIGQYFKGQISADSLVQIL